MPRYDKIESGKPDADFAAVLATPPEPYKETRCIVARYMSEHKNAEHIDAAVKNPKWSALQLSKALATLGVHISSSAILDHRGARCICYRTDEANV